MAKCVAMNRKNGMKRGLNGNKGKGAALNGGTELLKYKVKKRAGEE